MAKSSGERILGIQGGVQGRNPNYCGSNNLTAFRQLFAMEHMNTWSLCFLRENERHYSHVTRGGKQE